MLYARRAGESRGGIKASFWRLLAKSTRSTEHSHPEPVPYEISGGYVRADFRCHPLPRGVYLPPGLSTVSNIEVIGAARRYCSSSLNG